MNIELLIAYLLMMVLFLMTVGIVVFLIVWSVKHKHEDPEQIGVVSPKQTDTSSSEPTYRKDELTVCYIYRQTCSDGLTVTKSFCNVDICLAKEVQRAVKTDGYNPPRIEMIDGNSYIYNDRFVYEHYTVIETFSLGSWLSLDFYDSLSDKLTKDDVRKLQHQIYDFKFNKKDKE